MQLATRSRVSPARQALLSAGHVSVYINKVPAVHQRRHRTACHRGKSVAVPRWHSATALMLGHCLAGLWAPFVTLAAAIPEPEAAGGPPDLTFVPGPIEVGWQIYAGSFIAVIPFVIGSWEFGKRILIQRRCPTCGGVGLVRKGKYYKKCVDCGGFFPWLGWRTFWTSTAAPGNGGPLLQPRGQRSVLYEVPRPAEPTNAKQEPPNQSDRWP